MRDIKKLVGDGDESVYRASISSSYKELEAAEKYSAIFNINSKDMAIERAKHETKVHPVVKESARAAINSKRKFDQKMNQLKAFEALLIAEQSLAKNA